MSGIRIKPFILFLLLGTGCGKAPALPPTVPVTGTVTYNDKPLEGADVTFFPTDMQTGKSATGTTDSQGKFELETFVAGTTKAKGALVGEYQVAVSKTTGGSSMLQDFTGGDMSHPPKAPPPTDMPSPGAIGHQPEPPKSLLPEQYGNPKNSGLTASVKASGTQPFTFALKGE